LSVPAKFENPAVAAGGGGSFGEIAGATGGSGARTISAGCAGKEATTDTVVPISVMDARCMTAELSMRKQPEDCALPIDFTSLVPWMRYRVVPR
jgi:hypothetical protein